MSLDQAKALWASRRPARYTINFYLACSCSHEGFNTVTVDGESVVGHVDDGLLTVDRLSSVAEGARSVERLDALRVDPHTGVPVYVVFDQAQAEHGWAVVSVIEFSPA